MSLFVKVKLTHPDAVLPSQKVGDVGWDLSSVEDAIVTAGKVKSVKTGVVLAETPWASDIHKSILLKVEGLIPIWRLKNPIICNSNSFFFFLKLNF